MATVKDACRHLRSKNAGPFWVTIDLFFKDDATFEKYAHGPALGADVFAKLYGTDASLVRHYPVPSLHMVKISYPRPRAQGGELERDMHCGQQYVRLLDIELG
jgi:hypothetical protein